MELYRSHVLSKQDVSSGSGDLIDHLTGFKEVWKEKARWFRPVVLVCVRLTDCHSLPLAHSIAGSRTKT